MSIPGDAGRHHAGVGDRLEGAHLGGKVGGEGGAGVSRGGGRKAARDQT